MNKLLPTSLTLCIAMTALNASEDGFLSLFDGKSLQQWVEKGRPEDVAKAFWSVEDGVIQADSLGKSGHDYSWLLTAKEFGDFHLKFQVAALGGPEGNSGLQIRSRYDDAEYWLDGPQIDINPPGPWRTGLMWDETRENKRWIFPDLAEGWVNESMILNPSEFHLSADGGERRWNEMEVIAEGTRIRAWLNGVLVTDFDGAGILDDEVHARYDVGMKGHIALQIHKGDQVKVWFRDIRIEEL